MEQAPPTPTGGRRWIRRGWIGRYSIPTRDARQHPPHRFPQPKGAPLSDVVAVFGVPPSEVQHIAGMHFRECPHGITVIRPCFGFLGPVVTPLEDICVIEQDPFMGVYIISNMLLFQVALIPTFPGIFIYGARSKEHFRRITVGGSIVDVLLRSGQIRIHADAIAGQSLIPGVQPPPQIPFGTAFRRPRPADVIHTVDGTAGPIMPSHVPAPCEPYGSNRQAVCVGVSDMSLYIFDPRRIGVPVLFTGPVTPISTVVPSMSADA